VKATLSFHYQGCPFDEENVHRWACTCQPPLLIDIPNYRWACMCCEEPRAYEKLGVCDYCEDHAYAEPREVELLHQSRRQWEAGDAKGWKG
jgi:hypothetical protein